MNNRITQLQNDVREQERADRRREPQPIGVILAELLAQYQTRYPEVHIAVVTTPGAAV